MQYDLNTPLLTFSGKNSGQVNWTIRNAVEGVQIFGGIGSGKTSGSGHMLALKYLCADFGGLVLTAKPDEKEMWQAYCKACGRENDLLVIEPGSDNFFNFLEYESGTSDSGAAITDNVVQVLKTVIRASEDKAEGSSNDPFWETALDMLIFNVIDLCKLAYGFISVQGMYDMVQTLPKGDISTIPKDGAFQKALNIARAKISQKADEWERSLSVERLEELKANYLLYEEAAFEAIPESRSFKFVDQFFLETYVTLAERTRSIIDFSFSGFLFRLLRDPVFSLFCRYKSTFKPEDSLNGKIILINLPVKLFHKVGRDSQIMFKYIWQRAMEKRKISENGRPLFLWADEAQNFLHEHDADYQATARSSRIATVYISQNLPNYYANMGGAKSDHRVKSFLGTLSTKIFHANADIETNRYASELIGDTAYEDVTKSTTMAGEFSMGRSRAMRIDKLVRPEKFTGLKTGGEMNDYKSEAYVHLQGNLLQKDNNFVRMVFNQQYKPNLNSTI